MLQQVSFYQEMARLAKKLEQLKSGLLPMNYYNILERYHET